MAVQIMIQFFEGITASGSVKAHGSEFRFLAV